MNKSSKIFVAGHRGLVGSSIHRVLLGTGYTNIITRSRQELDLTSESAVNEFMNSERPEFVFLAAAKVGGIYANNTYPAEFIHQNLAIQNSIIHNSWRYGVEKLLFLGSSCIYPRDCPQPMHEDFLLTGPLEKTNEAYAIAKIAGIKMVQAYNRQYGTKYISVMPTNMYGPGDNYDLRNSHVLPALIRKFHEALPDNTVTVWGSGSPKREFLYSDDLARACILLMNQYAGDEFINIGAGEDQTIRDLAYMVQEAVGHHGDIAWDAEKPDGTPRKLLDVSKMFAFGWRPQISLPNGIRLAYQDFLASGGKNR